MGRKSNFGMRSGWVSAHSRLSMEGCSTYAISRSGRFLMFWRGQIHLTFKRNFDAPEWREWGEMENELAGIELTNVDDSVRWALTSHDQFTMHSLYVHWSFSGVRDLKIEELWHSKLPLKIKNFVWLVLRNRV
jgi:hypothetical protein